MKERKRRTKKKRDSSHKPPNTRDESLNIRNPSTEISGKNFVCSHLQGRVDSQNTLNRFRIPLSYFKLCR